MANLSRSPVLVDPLEGYSGVSLLTRTLNKWPNPPQPYEADGVHISHDFLKSMPIPSPNKLLGQAKAIVDSSSALLSSEMQSKEASKGKNEKDAANLIENPRERRPGLGRKRAQFSLKPNISQSSATLNQNLDIDKLKDPEEFFLAYEKLENAKREWHKQTGDMEMDTNQNTRSKRPRRPGLGRKSVTYKHRYPTESYTQETIEEDIHILSDHSIPEETANLNDTSHERGVADSVASPENKVNGILDGLLNASYEELDGDGAVSLLQKQLQIKPINLESLSLPDWQDVQRIDLKTSRRDLGNPRRPLSDVHNLKREINITRAKNKQTETSAHCFASPSPPKSLLASVSLFKKRILQSSPVPDPFSALNLDQSPERSASPIGSINNHSDKHDIGKDMSTSCKLKSLTVEENDTDRRDAVLFDVATDDYGSQSLRDNSKTLCPGVNDISEGSHSDMEDNHGGTSTSSGPLGLFSKTLGPGVNVNSEVSYSDMEDNHGGTSTVSVVKHLSRPDADAESQRAEPKELDDQVRSPQGLFSKTLGPGVNVNSEGSHSDIEDNHGGTSTSTVIKHSSTPDADAEFQRAEPKELEDQVDGKLQETVAFSQHDLGREDSTLEVSNGCQNQLGDDLESSAPTGDNATNGSFKTTDKDQEQHQEKAKSPGIPMNKVSKRISRPSKGRESKTLSRRKSLAAAGTSWESGLRRSTRIKSRPLEFWKGERFLYGRIHESLATVIGIKYESPSKDDSKPGLKVKSFVSDAYKEMLASAALH